MNREITFFGHEKFVCVWNTSTDTFVTEIHSAEFFAAGPILARIEHNRDRVL